MSLLLIVFWGQMFLLPRKMNMQGDFTSDFPCFQYQNETKRNIFRVQGLRKYSRDIGQPAPGNSRDTAYMKLFGTDHFMCKYCFSRKISVALAFYSSVEPPQLVSHSLPV